MFPTSRLAQCVRRLLRQHRRQRERTAERTEGRNERSEARSAITTIRSARVIAAAMAGLMIGTSSRPAHADQSPKRVPAFSEERAVEDSSSHTEQKSEAAISIKAPLVNLHVLVTDRDGRVLSGLKRDNFRIFDNVQAQVITHFEPASAPIAIAMLMEYSGTAYNHFAYKAALCAQTSSITSNR